MKCPRCAAPSAVINSRVADVMVRRRRLCDECGHRWTTIEMDAATLDSRLEGLLVRRTPRGHTLTFKRHVNGRLVQHRVQVRS